MRCWRMERRKFQSHVPHVLTSAIRERFPWRHKASFKHLQLKTFNVYFSFRSLLSMKEKLALCYFYAMKVRPWATAPFKLMLVFWASSRRASLSLTPHFLGSLLSLSVGGSPPRSRFPNLSFDYPSHASTIPEFWKADSNRIFHSKPGEGGKWNCFPA